MATLQQEFSTQMHFHSPSLTCSEQKRYVWTVAQVIPFDDLVISWNAHRPIQGQYVILSRVLIGATWSPWLLYAVWGAEEQYSFHDTNPLAPVRSFQDQVELLKEEVATGFSICIVACKGADLGSFSDLYACTTKLNTIQSERISVDSNVSLAVPQISQLCLTHPRNRSLCSPTSTTAIVRYHLSNADVCPLKFAKNVYDAGFDIYGNWSFNVAQAFVELGSDWRCFCGRMKSIEWLFHILNQGLPVVISVKGSLPGALVPYSNGHLIVIKGFDRESQQFLCMDPAFPSAEQTEAAYPLEALIEVWKARYFITYFFLKRDEFLKITF